jgi:hypothetical protein
MVIKTMWPSNGCWDVSTGVSRWPRIGPPANDWGLTGLERVRFSLGLIGRPTRLNTDPS